jgi:hypothetical protein
MKRLTEILGKKLEGMAWTLSEEPPQITVADKEKEAMAIARDYVVEYHPQLINNLGLTAI